MNLKPYPEYKDSGVEWIDEIPRGWELRRLKYNSSVNPPGKKSLSDPNAKINFLPMEKVSENGDYDLGSETEYENVSSGYTYFEDNDVLLAKITPCFENGKGALVKKLKHGFGFGTTEFHILRFGDNTYPNFLYFLTKSHLFRVTGEAFMEGAAGQKRVSTDFVKNFPMPTPPLIEQKQIVNYLNKKTSEIDLTIEKDTRLIELLKEKRTALINHVVTKGLDPTVKMKDSGVEWIGKMPEDWEISKIKHATTKILTGKTPPSEQEEYYDKGELNWFTPGDLGDNLVLTKSSKRISKLAILNNKVIKYKPFSILLVGIGATLGKVGLSIEEGTSNQQINAIEFYQNKIMAKYGLYYLYGMKNLIISLSNSSTIGIFNQTQTGNFIILKPPINEQKRIVEKLDNETSRIDFTIQKIQQKIELLEEYKKSLIHHVVTGKVDVREVAV